MRVGLFGGSFNPPHMAHLLLAEWIRENTRLDEVWWMPNRIPPHKIGEPIASTDHRVAMVRLAIKDAPTFKLSTIELDREGPSFTVDSLRLLIQQHPEIEFQLIIGGDSLVDFMTWRSPEEIVEMAPLLVYGRPGAHIEEAVAYHRFADRIQLVDAPLLEISSRVIRERVRGGQSIQFQVPAAVAAYIHAHHLYQSEDA